MAAGKLTAFRAGLRWKVMVAMLVPLAAGLASAVPGPQAKAAAAPADLIPVLACGARPVTAYVADGSGTVTPIATRTNTPGPPITISPTLGPSRSRRTARPPTSPTMVRAR